MKQRIAKDKPTEAVDILALGAELDFSHATKQIVSYFNGLPDANWLREVSRCARLLGLAFVLNAWVPVLVLVIAFILLGILNVGSSGRAGNIPALLFVGWHSGCVIAYCYWFYRALVKPASALIDHPLKVWDASSHTKREIEDYLSWGALHRKLPKLGYVFAVFFIVIEVSLAALAFCLTLVGSIITGLHDAGSIGMFMLLILFALSSAGLFILCVPQCIYLIYVGKLFDRSDIKVQCYLLFGFIFLGLLAIAVTIILAEIGLLILFVIFFALWVLQQVLGGTLIAFGECLSQVHSHVTRANAKLGIHD